MRIEKYGNRNWAVYDPSGSLVCITVYKKGATKVVSRLSSTESEGLIKAHTDLHDLTKLGKELREINQKFTNLIKQFKSENMPKEAVLYNYNEKGADM